MGEVAGQDIAHFPKICRALCKCHNEMGHGCFKCRQSSDESLGWALTMT